MLSGCHGSAAYQRGEECYQRGEYRRAYAGFWEACREEPSARHLEGLERAGRKVAEAERAQGAAAEGAGELQLALKQFALGLEYDSHSLPLAVAFEQLWSLLEERRGHEVELLELRKLAPERRGWREVELLEALAQAPDGRGNVEAELREAVARAARARGAGLRRRTLEEPLPMTAGELAQLGAGWLEARGEWLAVIDAEEANCFSPSPSRRAMALWGLYADELSPYLEEANSALALLEEAAAGLKACEEGERLERAGELEAAIGAYHAAVPRHPFLEAARLGLSRAQERFVKERYRASLLALRRRDWRGALDDLLLLRRFLPENGGEAAELVKVAQAELAAQHLLEARRFAESGLWSNALVRYYLALDLKGEDQVLKRTVEHVEETLASRLRPSLRVAFRPGAGGQARSELWGVGEEVVARLDRDLLAATQSRLDEALEARYGERRASRRLFLETELVVVEIDFSYPLGEVAPGVESARFVTSVQMAENPELEGLKVELAAARQSLEQAEALAARAPSHKRGVAAELLLLSRLKCAQEERRLAELPLVVARAEWQDVSYPTRQVQLQAMLACRYRLEGESRRVSAEMELRDRVVEGDPSRNVPPDPEELPSRAEVLRLLGPRLAAAIVGDVEQCLEARLERFYHEGLRHFQAHSFDLAMENLVTYLYGRRSESDELTLDAARRIEEILGTSVPALWARLQTKGPNGPKAPAASQGRR